ncbi:MAG: SusC/RagA family protein [Crocinitomicaceae bacterium]|nr:SusC/RagA family protein [Crocinitomicaceae bacterium]|tara:strand:- start:8894 stop:11917 length:3024 start_codon:yes stop_codon:yes gene_type:complete
MSAIKSFIVFLFISITLNSISQYSISGLVQDQNGESLIGTTVLIKELSKGTSSDIKGYYNINDLPKGSYTLVFSAVGYITITENIELKNNLQKNIIMKEDVLLLNEAVVIGYGTARTKDLTGSAVAVSEDDFLKGSLASPEQLIMGKVPGLKVTSNDGGPGSGSSLRIRGGTSINASNDPLIVVDGVPLDNGGIAGAANPLSLINPNDIESFVVLKDASACAIYGSRAANGVILITTKKGKGKLSITVNQKTSVSTVVKYADVLSGDSLWNLVQNNGNAAQIQLLGDTNYNTNWQREVFRTAIVNDFNIAVSKKFFRFSYGNRIDNGLLKKDQFIRNNISLNINPSFLDNHIQIESNNKLVQSSSNFADRGALGAAYFDPTKPVISGDSVFGGYYEWLQNSGSPNTLSAKNPVGLINQRKDISQVSRYIANSKVTYKTHFLPELKLVYNAGVDFSEGSGTVEVLSSSAAGYFSEGSYNTYRSNKRNFLSEAYFSFNNNKEDKKSFIDIIGGYSYQYWNSESPNLPVYNASQDSIIYPAAENPFFTENALLSYYTRAIYNFNDRYVFNAALRRDGSSRFSPAARWGLFPSLSAAWIISGEKFMKNFNSINLLKIRFGYGVTGQQDGIGDYAYISNYYEGTSTAQYSFGSDFYYVYRPGAFDANLKWEETLSYNLGVDFGLFNDRISGSLDFYQKETKDLLATVAVPAGTNFSNQILTNVGGMLNKGVEFNVNIGLFANKDLRLDLVANATYNLNKVTKLALIEDTNSVGIQVGGISGGIGNTVQVHSVGFSTFSYLLYQQLYDNNGEFIEVGQQANIDVNNDGTVDSQDKWQNIHAYADLNNDGDITPEDKYIFNKTAPDFLFGAALNMNYKKWYAGLSFRAELGGYIYNNIHSNTSTFQSLNGTQGFLNNISSLYYNNQVQSITPNQLLSDHYLEKANFLRLDFLNIGYDFGKISEKIPFNMDASFTVQNVFVLTKYQGLDPELGGGIDNNIYPRPRLYSINFKFNF